MRARSIPTATLRVEVFESQKQTALLCDARTQLFSSPVAVSVNVSGLFDVTVGAQCTSETLTLKAFCLVTFCKKAHRAFCQQAHKASNQKVLFGRKPPRHKERSEL